jgi:hypothetical protein
MASSVNATLPAIPDGYRACGWCGAGNRLDEHGQLPAACFNCRLDPRSALAPAANKQSGSTSGKGAGKPRTGKSRGAVPRHRTFDPVAPGRPIVGIDPGARYTGVVVRDGDVVLHSSTLVRPKELSSGTDWALAVVGQLQQILAAFPTAIPIAVEGISDPKGFHKGEKAAINPRDIIRAGIVLGAVIASWPRAIIVEPGGNGSQHASHYPPELVGRRPASLPGSSQGAGTRGHEQSAFDVAGKGAKVAYPRGGEPVNFS